MAASGCKSPSNIVWRLYIMSFLMEHSRVPMSFTKNELLRPEADAFCCGHRSQHSWGQGDAFSVWGPPHFVVARCSDYVVSLIWSPRLIKFRCRFLPIRYFCTATNWFAVARPDFLLRVMKVVIFFIRLIIHIEPHWDMSKKVHRILFR